MGVQVGGRVWDPVESLVMVVAVVEMIVVVKQL